MFTPRFINRFCFVITAIVAAAGHAPAKADVVYTFDTAAGASTSGGSVSGQAVLDVSSNEIQITLSNTATSIANMGQVLTGITFTLSGSPGTPSVATGLSGSSANVALVDGGNLVLSAENNPNAVFGKETITFPSPYGTNTYDGWTISASGKSTDLSVFGTGGPNFGILDKQTTYDTNGSIAGNGPHNPFSVGSAEFNVTYSGGVSSSTIVSNVVFQFGTGGETANGVFVPPPGVQVPEPCSLMIWGSLGFAAAAYGRRRQSAA